jgi:hypothetical protein
MTDDVMCSMTGPASRRDSRWLVWYVAMLLLGVGSVYVLTRSSILIGDGERFVSVARLGDATQFHYGEPTHFLQVVLAGGIWRGLGAIGVPVPLEYLFVGMSLLGTLAAAVFLGLIAWELLGVRSAAWIAAVLFGTSLHSWTQWNGELYGLALGFVTAGLFLAARGRILPAAGLWALSVLSHAEFALAAPALIVAVWMAPPAAVPAGSRLRKASLLLLVAGASTLLILLAGTYALGKWAEASSMVEWLRGSQAARQIDVASRPEVVRAIKGLLTAFTVGGHYWRDILTGRGALGNPLFLLAAAAGFLVLVLTGILVAAAAWRRRLVLFALAWLLPFHIVVNWWFVPTVEKYHAGALPGLVLLVTGGLIHLASRLPTHMRTPLLVGYVIACASLNLFGAVLPMQTFGREVARAEREIRLLHDEQGGRPVFIACDDPRALVNAGVEFFRLRSFWTGNLQEVRQTTLSWTLDRLREGREPYLVGRWCLPEEWRNTSSTDPFDLFFLEESFQLTPTRITGIPIASTVPTNPFNSTWGDVLRLEPKQRSGAVAGSNANPGMVPR